MEKKERSDLVYKVGVFYGASKQKLKLCEECAELIQAIIRGDIKHITEEMADVRFLIDQIAKVENVEEFLDSIYDYKVMRQITRIAIDSESKGELPPQWVSEVLEYEHES